ncbi:V-type ATP synthase subunit D [bacterium BMS3Abin14]|nr:V-type ATP synthase subunit D [bacterium BMS3Abin14]
MLCVGSVPPGTAAAICPTPSGRMPEGRRRINALEQSIFPSMKNRGKGMMEALQERERRGLFRLKHIKNGKAGTIGRYEGAGKEPDREKNQIRGAAIQAAPLSDRKDFLLLLHQGRVVPSSQATPSGWLDE